MIEIIRNWKKKRQDHKQAEHEKLLVELAEMVDKRRAEWITYISRKKIISFDKQKSTKTRMFSCFFNTHKF